MVKIMDPPRVFLHARRRFAASLLVQEGVIPSIIYLLKTGDIQCVKVSGVVRIIFFVIRGCGPKRAVNISLRGYVLLDGRISTARISLSLEPELTSNIGGMSNYSMAGQ